MSVHDGICSTMSTCLLGMYFLVTCYYKKCDIVMNMFVCHREHISRETDWVYTWVILFSQRSRFCPAVLILTALKWSAMMKTVGRYYPAIPIWGGRMFYPYPPSTSPVHFCNPCYRWICPSPPPPILLALFLSFSTQCNYTVFSHSHSPSLDNEYERD